MKCIKCNKKDAVYCPMCFIEEFITDFFEALIEELKRGKNDRP